MLTRFRSNNHPQQVKKRGANPIVDDRALPVDDFTRFHERFNFTVDVAASERNHKLARYHTAEDCGLRATWARERVYCNPPYSNIRPWVEKAHAERMADLIVLLLPANRTEQGWWHDLVEPFRDRTGSRLRVEFIKGRLRFIKHDATHVGPNERPPFGCCLLIWDDSTTPAPS